MTFKKKYKYCLNSILLLDAKLLTNINHLDFFFFWRMSIDAKNLTKLFTPDDVAE